MTNSWDDMRRAKEDSYFEKKNEEAVARLAKKKTEKPRLSPVTGEPMEHVVVNGVVVDRCPTSGGIWLDAAELEHFLGHAKAAPATSGENWLTQFFHQLMGGK